MALVDYSDSECSNDGDRQLGKAGARKRKYIETIDPDLPPLPQSFHDLYASTTRLSNQDDPDLHGGRQRMTPHVEGNWPTHVYIEWHPSQEESSHLRAFLFKVNKGNDVADFHVHSLLESDLRAELPLHISLSRPIVLVTDRRQSFLESLMSKTKASGIRPFEISMTRLNWVANYEKTRWFLVLRVKKTSSGGLSGLLRVSNEVTEAFGQPPLYKDSQPSSSRGRSGKLEQDVTHENNAFDISSSSIDQLPSVRRQSGPDMTCCFHISIAWSLSPPSRDIFDALENLDTKQILALRVKVNTLKVKIGNAITAIELPTRLEASHGVIGS